MNRIAFYFRVFAREGAVNLSYMINDANYDYNERLYYIFVPWVFWDDFLYLFEGAGILKLPNVILGVANLPSVSGLFESVKPILCVPRPRLYLLSPCFVYNKDRSAPEQVPLDINFLQYVGDSSGAHIAIHIRITSDMQINDIMNMYDVIFSANLVANSGKVYLVCEVDGWFTFDDIDFKSYGVRISMSIKNIVSEILRVFGKVDVVAFVCGIVIETQSKDVLDQIDLEYPILYNIYSNDMDFLKTTIFL